MQRPRALLLLLALLAAGAGAAAGSQAGGSSCEPAILATQVSLFCAPDMPTAQCCEPVVASVDLGGGVPCLCRVAAEPQLIIAGLNATHLITLYAACGGLRPGGSLLAAACQGPAPPAAGAGAVTAAPPPSAAPRRKQPSHDAPPPPGEKTAAPPQHGKQATITVPGATPPGPATTPASPLSPGQATPPPPHSGSVSDIAHLNLMTVSLALLLIVVHRRRQN